MYSGLDHMYMALGDGCSPYAKTNQSPVDAGKWTHIVYAVDKLVYEMPNTTFIVLVAIAMVLLIVGAIVSRKNHG